MATGTNNILSLINNLPKFTMSGGGINPVVNFNWTGSSMVIAYYTSYKSASDNYGHQLVLNSSGIRYDSVTNGVTTTIWNK